MSTEDGMYCHPLWGWLRVHTGAAQGRALTQVACSGNQAGASAWVMSVCSDTKGELWILAQGCSCVEVWSIQGGWDVTLSGMP